MCSRKWLTMFNRSRAWSSHDAVWESQHNVVWDTTVSSRSFPSSSSFSSPLCPCHAASATQMLRIRTPFFLVAACMSSQRASYSSLTARRRLSRPCSPDASFSHCRLYTHLWRAIRRSAKYCHVANLWTWIVQRNILLHGKLQLCLLRMCRGVGIFANMLSWHGVFDHSKWAGHGKVLCLFQAK